MPSAPAQESPGENAWLPPSLGPKEVRGGTTSTAHAVEERHPLASLGHGSVVTLIGQVVMVGALFGTRVLLVTSLNAQFYGDLALGLAITGLLSSLGSLGLPSAVARQLAHTTDVSERWRIVVHSLMLTIPAATLTGAIVFVAAPELALWFQGTPVVYQFLAVNLSLGLISGVVTSFFQGNEDAFPNMLFNQILNPVLTIGFLMLLLARAASIESALLAYVVAGMLTLVGATAYTVSPFGFPWKRGELASKGQSLDPKASTLLALLAFSLPLMLVGLSTAAVGTVDTIVLGALRGPAPVAAYNAVLPLARLVALAVTALGYIMLPVAARLHRLGDMPELGRSYATITKWVMLISLPFFLLFFLLPAASLTFVYRAGFLATPGYGSAPLLLQVTCLGSFAFTIAGPSTAVLIGLGKLRLLVVNTFVSAGADAGLSLALVPFWGSLGAAVAFAIATALLPILCTIQIYLLTGIHPFSGPRLRPLVVVTAPTVVVLGLLTWWAHWVPSNLELVGLFFVLFAAYLFAVLLTRSLEAGDHHLLRVVEGYLGRELTFVRRFGRRFVPTPEDAPAAPGRT